MSGPLPFEANLSDASCTKTQEHDETQSLRDQIAALTLENKHLRQSLTAARAKAPPSAPAQQTPELVEPSGCAQASAQPDEPQATRDALLTALGSVFPIGVFHTDATGLLTQADPNLQQMFGLKWADFAHFGWLAAIHPQDRQRARDSWFGCASQPGSHSLEFRLLRGGNETRHVLIRHAPKLDAAGRFLGHLGFVQDITEQRELEANARLKEELNRQIIASSPDCTKVLDMQGQVLQMTARGCELVEVDDFETVRNSNWCGWWPAESRPVVQTALNQVARGEMSRFVAFGPTFKNTPRWWDVAMTPICDRAGKPIMLLVVSRDISELHGRQEEVRALNESLEARVQLRTQELAEANQRISQTLAHAQTLYNQAPCGYHSIGRNGVYVAMNDTELAWLGYAREEVVGKLTYQDLMLPKNAAMLQERLQCLLSHGFAEPAEYELRRRDGSVFPALVSSTAVRDAQGDFLYSNTTVVDITARKAAELALQANQRFIQAITDHVPGLIAYLDTELRFRFANANHLAMCGMEAHTLLGQPMSECFSTDIYSEIAPRLRAALAGETQRFETWRQTAQGQPIFISATYVPDWHEGEVRGIFVQVIDITERKRIEERVRGLNTELEQRVHERSIELMESEQRFRLMVDNMRDYAVFFLDTSGRITDWTDSAQRMDGFSPTEMLGQHHQLLFSPTGNARAQADQLLMLASSSGQQEINGWHTRKDGSRYWAYALLIALRDGQGELRGFAMINRDMTDAKRVEDLMHNINDDLEQRVTERTAQLLAANKDLESFSYSVSHDLRSPLRHVASFVSLLQEHLGAQCDETTTRYLGTIGNSARHMSQLIDGLLAFSHLGRAAINIAPVDFKLLLQTEVAQLAHDTEGRSIEWVLAPDWPVVLCDALLLREVWANLLGNAYKYTRLREHARIEVGWGVDPAKGHTFYVRDNGVGFDTKYSVKLFGVFQRLHRASEFEGTGIGLALTRRIVERHGGTIWAESQLGEGSVFSFSLPFESLLAADSSPEQMHRVPSR